MASSLPPRIYGPDQVDVAYEPWRVIDRTAVRVGPDEEAPVVLHGSGEPVILEYGRHFGRQTTRNPRCLDAPPLRPAVNGFVWGYGMRPASRKSGWLRLADLVGDPAYDALACGPAGVDFDRRDPRACGGHCDGRPLTDTPHATGIASVRAREVYLRYAPHSTAFLYLVRGDDVRLLVRTADGRWAGVEVTAGRWTRRGARGWVLAGALHTAR